MECWEIVPTKVEKITPLSSTSYICIIYMGMASPRLALVVEDRLPEFHVYACTCMYTYNYMYMYTVYLLEH